MAETSNKISLSKKIAYGIGQIGDTVPYTLFYTFYLIYLTDVVGIRAIVAGAVSAIAIIWNAVLDPVIGYLSDNCRSGKGRRRTFMGKIIIPYVVITALLFFPIEISETLQAVYYTALGVALWTCYTVWVIPYLSLVSDMTTDHDERNNIRMFNILCGAIYIAISASGPMAVQAFVLSLGYSAKTGWAVSGITFALLTGVGLFISWFGLRGTEPDASIFAGAESKDNIFVILKKSFKIKAFRQICLMTIVGIIGITIVEAVEMYLFMNRLDMSEGQISLLYLMYAVAGIVMVPALTAIMNKIGKRELFIIVSAVSAAGALLFCIFGINTPAMAMIYIVLVFSLFAGVFWTVYITFAYDIAEIYEYKYGQRCDGSIVAIVDLSYKLGAAVASFLSGVLLTAIGYVEGGANQSPEVLDGINTICTLPAVITFVIAGAIVFMYPVTRQKYNLLVAGIKARREGIPYDESEFANLLK